MAQLVCCGIKSFSTGCYREGVVNGYQFLINDSKKLIREGVNFFDLSMVFSDTEDILYADQCCHFNEKGNELLGEVIGKDIVNFFENELLLDPVTKSRRSLAK